MPPKFYPKNTATREYYGVDKSDAPSDDWPSSASSTNLSPKEGNKKDKDKDKESVVENTGTSPAGKGSQMSPPEKSSLTSLKGEKSGEADQPPSPTPSDVVLAADLEDTGVMGEMNKKLVKNGVGEKERKNLLLQMQARLVQSREKQWRGRGDENK